MSNSNMWILQNEVTLLNNAVVNDTITNTEYTILTKNISRSQRKIIMDNVGLIVRNNVILTVKRAIGRMISIPDSFHLPWRRNDDECATRKQLSDAYSIICKI